MKKLQEIHDNFNAINLLYNGENTNWNDMLRRLKILETNLECIKINQSKSSNFYNYIKRRLKTDLFKEITRIEKKLILIDYKEV